MSNKHGICFDTLTVGDIAEVFHVTRRTLNNWIVQGCPRNPDKTMSVYQVHNWLIGRKEEKTIKNKPSLKEQKLLQEIEMLELKIQKEKSETVPRELYEATLNTRIKDWTENWQRSFMKNVVYFVGKNADELKVLAWNFLCGVSGYMANEK